MALYLTYRPQTFNAVVGQTHIVRTLQNALKDNRIGHAYLFTGPRGTGKTSIARILAKAANCLAPVVTETGFEPCDQCHSCTSIARGSAMDIVEIDAASNTGVDNIRDLREKISFRPTELRYKVYIIDEVHMLSKGAFNALLKTLEEPPDHAIFILATTEPYEVPATIVSRCQRYDFRFLQHREIVEQLQKIAESEHTALEDTAADFIAQLSHGALRDALSLLEQIMSYQRGTITRDDIKTALGILDQSQISSFFALLGAGKTGEAILAVHRLAGQGQDMGQFIKSCIEYGRQVLLSQLSGKAYLDLLNISAEDKQAIQEDKKLMDSAKLLAFMKNLLEVKNQLRKSDNPLVPVELALLQSFQETARNVAVSASPAAAVSTPAQDPAQPQEDTQQPVPFSAPGKKESSFAEKIKRKHAEAETVPDAPSAHTVKEETIIQKWNQILDAAKPHNHSVAAFLKGGTPRTIDPEGRLVIEFQYSFHKEQIEKRLNKSIVEDAIFEVCGQRVPITCLLVAKAGKPTAPAAQKSLPGAGNTADPKQTSDESPRISVDDALKMFGGKVV